ncbi:hypothetical protein FFI87_007170 [Burkholderia sp. KBS0801]|nr:hypothetical protein FFI87_007170 [Burkholderia sp. KBS0801]
MKGEFNHVCGTARAACSLPRARSSPAHAPRRYWNRTGAHSPMRSPRRKDQGRYRRRASAAMAQR